MASSFFEISSSHGGINIVIFIAWKTIILISDSCPQVFRA